VIRINLLPVREARRQASMRQHGILFGIAAAAAIGLCVLIHGAVVAQIADQRSKVVAAEEELKKLEKTLKQVKRFRAEKAEIERKLEVIARLEASRTGPVRIMDEVASRIPERMWLKSMRLQGGTLEMHGFGIDNETIAAFLTSLEESKQLANVELLESKLKQSKGLNLNEFKIKAQETRKMAAAKTARKGKKKKGGKRGGRRRR
jgi:type IV pilus assembly protein PilN